MEHNLKILDYCTIGCSCGKWEHWINENTTDKQMSQYHNAHKSNVNRRLKDQVYRDLGMKKVKYALGGTYYE